MQSEGQGKAGSTVLVASSQSYTRAGSHLIFGVATLEEDLVSQHVWYTGGTAGLKPNSKRATTQLTSRNHCSQL